MLSEFNAALTLSCWPREGRHSKSQDYSTTYPLLLDGLGHGPAGSSVRQVVQGSGDPFQSEDRMNDQVI